jgi:hypothetical protein
VLAQLIPQLLHRPASLTRVLTCAMAHCSVRRCHRPAVCLQSMRSPIHLPRIRAANGSVSCTLTFGSVTLTRVHLVVLQPGWSAAPPEEDAGGGGGGGGGGIGGGASPFTVTRSLSSGVVDMRSRMRGFPSFLDPPQSARASAASAAADGGEPASMDSGGDGVFGDDEDKIRVRPLPVVCSHPFWPAADRRRVLRRW